MEFARFNEIVNRVRTENPFLFELGHDAILSEAELSAFEKKNKFQLSNKYKQFLLRYGGGYFGYAYLYSLDRNSIFIS